LLPWLCFLPSVFVLGGCSDRGSEILSEFEYGPTPKSEELSSFEKSYSPKQFTTGVIAYETEAGYLLAANGYNGDVIWDVDKQVAFLMVLDGNGNLVSSVDFASHGRVMITDMTPCSDSTFILLGVWTTQARSSEFWAMRVKSDATILWDRKFGSAGDEAPCCIVPMSDETYLLTGVQRLCDSEYRPFLVRINKDGDEIWRSSLDVQGHTGVSDAVEMPDGDLLLVGNNSRQGFGGISTGWSAFVSNQGDLLSESTLSRVSCYRGVALIDSSPVFICSLRDVAEESIEVIKTDLSLEPVWSMTLPDHPFAYTSKITAVDSNRILVCNSRPGSDGQSYAMTLTCLLENGCINWSHSYDSGSSSQASSVSSCSDSGFVVVGSRWNPSGSGKSAFMVRCNSSGECGWSGVVSGIE